MLQARKSNPLAVSLFLFFGLSGSFLFAAPARSQGRDLPLVDYLTQVRSKNQSVTASIQTAQGALERSSEGDLIFAPQLFGVATLSRDASASTSVPRDHVIFNTYTLGVSKIFDFGLTAKAYYNVNYTNMVGVNPAYAQLLTSTLYNDAKPGLELSQALWRNFGGKETRATQELVEAGALATSYAESYKIKLTLADAESTYWRLALARDTVAITRENLDRATKLRDWSSRRVSLQLADRTDLLQAQAALQLRALELQTALDEESAAARAFNSARGLDADKVPERLPTLTQNVLTEMQAPKRAQFREDVMAAQQQQRIAQANASIGREKNLPTLEVYAQLALNGRDPELLPAVGRSFTINNPTNAVGVRFSSPLDIGTLSRDRAGYARESKGAEEALFRKYFDQEREWKDLLAKLEENRTRLGLAHELESAQKEKLRIERERLSRGRTTTYQVVLFEQDYAQAQLSRIQTEAVLLRIIAQMRTFAAGGAS